MQGRVMLIGEQPPQRWAVDPVYRAKHSPMFPYPPRSAGARMREFSGLSLGEYIHGLERVNLIPEWTAKWDKDHARHRAADLIRCHCPSAVFTLGVRVAEAFGYSGRIPHEDHSQLFACDMIYLPHPSGRNPVWSQSQILEFVAAAFDKRRAALADWQERRPTLLVHAED